MILKVFLKGKKMRRHLVYLFFSEQTRIPGHCDKVKGIITTCCVIAQKGAVPKDKEHSFSYMAENPLLSLGTISF